MPNQLLKAKDGSYSYNHIQEIIIGRHCDAEVEKYIPYLHIISEMIPAYLGSYCHCYVLGSLDRTTIFSTYRGWMWRIILTGADMAIKLSGPGLFIEKCFAIANPDSVPQAYQMVKEFHNNYFTGRPAWV